MNLRANFTETTEILNRFVQVVNSFSGSGNTNHIQHAAVLTAGELAGSFENLTSELDESDIIYKLNHTIDLAGSLIFWTKNLENISAISHIESKDFQNHFSKTKNILSKLRNETGKTVVPSFLGEWLLVD